MPKFDALKSDFSAGELSPRSQGHVDSEAYQAGLALAANMMATRGGTVASRAGGQWLTDGANVAADTVATGLDNTPVQHLPVTDGPFGDFVIEIGGNGMRLMDRFGVLDFVKHQKAPLFNLNFQNASTWGDPDSGSVYLKDNVNQIITNPIANAAGYPTGTNGHWILSGRCAGTDITVTILEGTPVVFTVSPATDGTFSVDFLPVNTSYQVQVSALNSVMWDLKLTKNPQEPGINILPPFGFAPPIPGLARIRHAAFWTSQDRPFLGNPATFWVAFAGGTDNAWAGWALSWAVTPSGQGQWVFAQLPCLPDHLALIQGSNTVAVYQDRLFFGNNAGVAGRPQILGSGIGFQMYIDAHHAQLAAPTAFGGTLLAVFQFKVMAESRVCLGTTVAPLDEQYNQPDGGFPQNHNSFGTDHTDFFRFNFRTNLDTRDPNGVPFPDPQTDGSLARLVITRPGSPPILFPYVFAPLPPIPANPVLRQEVPEPGTFYCVSPGVGAFGVGVSAPSDGSSGVIVAHGGVPLPGDILTLTVLPEATDPLILTLASPTGNIAWMNVLRGLLLGTTKNEKLFPSGEPLTIDPATGASFTLEDESSLGADLALPALDVNDKVLFMQRGRQVVRLANISIATSGGLVAEDIGVAGEHLLKARVRTLCYLKSPVPRVVFGMDDGTGAVMTLGGKIGISWSRFTIPAQYGGIYNVAALDGANGSELWVGMENGVTLHWNSFESDILVKQRLVPRGTPLPPQHITYDTENPLPPVMDGWQRAGLNALGKITGLSASAIGLSAHVFVNGQVYGPYPVTDIGGGAGSGHLKVGGITLPAADFTFALGTTWTDESGVVRPQEVYVGFVYPDHRFVTLPLEGGNPAGTAQAYKGRWAQCTLRLVDSYRPVAGGFQVPERGAIDPADFLAGRLTGDVRATQLSFRQATKLQVSQPLPLRLEVSAIFGGAQINTA